MLFTYLKSNPYLLLLMALGFICFIYGFNHGTIQSVYPDETYFDLYAFKIAGYLQGKGISYQLDPPFYSFILLGAYSLYYFVGLLTGSFQTLQDFIIEFSIHRENFISIGRLVSGIMAFFTIPLIYSLSNKIKDKQTAIIATSGFIFCYPVIWFSHTVHHTTISILISALILFFSYNVLLYGKTKDYLLAGISIGLGIGIKIYPGLFALSLVVGHFYYLHSNNFKIFKHLYKIILSAILAILFTFISYPWPVVEYHKWQQYIQYTVNDSFFTGGNPFHNLYYLIWGFSDYYEKTTAEPFSFWSNSLRILSETTLVIILVSIPFLLLKYKKEFLFLLLPFIIFLLHHIIRGGLAFGTRQFYFLLPSLYISYGLLVGYILNTFKKNKQNLVVLIIIILIYLQPIYFTTKYLYLNSRPTTIEIARAYSLEKIPKGSVLYTNYAGPFYNMASWNNPINNDNKYDSLVYLERKKNMPPFAIKALQELNFDEEIRLVNKDSIPIYLAITDYNSTVFYNFENCKLWGLHKYHKMPVKYAYYNNIYHKTEEIFTISPSESKAFGPQIKFYKLIANWNPKN